MDAAVGIRRSSSFTPIRSRCRGTRAWYARRASTLPNWKRSRDRFRLDEACCDEYQGTVVTCHSMLRCRRACSRLCGGTKSRRVRSVSRPARTIHQPGVAQPRRSNGPVPPARAARLQQGHRTDPLMSPVAKTLSTEDVQALAAYFSSQRPMSSSYKADSAKIAKGQSIASDSQCTMCHLGGFSGQNEIPVAAGQQYQYVVKQL